MANERGHYVPLSLPRKWIIDLMHFASRVPTAGGERTLRVRAAVEARAAVRAFDPNDLVPRAGPRGDVANGPLWRRPPPGLIRSVLWHQLAGLDARKDHSGIDAADRRTLLRRGAADRGNDCPACLRPS